MVLLKCSYTSASAPSLDAKDIETIRNTDKLYISLAKNPFLYKALDVKALYELAKKDFKDDDKLLQQPNSIHYLIEAEKKRLQESKITITGIPIPADLKTNKAAALGYLKDLLGKVDTNFNIYGQFGANKPVLESKFSVGQSLASRLEIADKTSVDSVFDRIVNFLAIKTPTDVKNNKTGLSEEKTKPLSLVHLMMRIAKDAKLKQEFNDWKAINFSLLDKMKQLLIEIGGPVPVKTSNIVNEIKQLISKLDNDLKKIPSTYNTDKELKKIIDDINASKVLPDNKKKKDELEAEEKRLDDFAKKNSNEIIGELQRYLKYVNEIKEGKNMSKTQLTTLKSVATDLGPLEDEMKAASKCERFKSLKDLENKLNPLKPNIIGALKEEAEKWSAEIKAKVAAGSKLEDKDQKLFDFNDTEMGKTTAEIVQINTSYDYIKLIHNKVMADKTKTTTPDPQVVKFDSLYNAFNIKLTDVTARISTIIGEEKKDFDTRIEAIKTKCEEFAKLDDAKKPTKQSELESEDKKLDNLKSEAMAAANKSRAKKFIDEIKTLAGEIRKRGTTYESEVKDIETKVAAINPETATYAQITELENYEKNLRTINTPTIKSPPDTKFVDTELLFKKCQGLLSQANGISDKKGKEKDIEALEALIHGIELKVKTKKTTDKDAQELIRAKTDLDKLIADLKPTSAGGSGSGSGQDKKTPEDGKDGKQGEPQKEEEKGTEESPEQLNTNTNVKKGQEPPSSGTGLKNPTQTSPSIPNVPATGWSIGAKLGIGAAVVAGVGCVVGIVIYFTIIRKKPNTTGTATGTAVTV